MEANRLIKNGQSELNLPKDNAYILSSKIRFLLNCIRKHGFKKNELNMKL